MTSVQCPECGSVLSGNETVCPQCGFNIADTPKKASEPTPLETLLNNFNTESVMSKAEKSIHGGLRFLFSVFIAIACFFFITALLSPLLCVMLIPESWQSTVNAISTPVFVCLAFFSLTIGIGISIFKEMAVYSKLVKQISGSDYDVTSRISQELTCGWDQCEKSGRINKKKNIKALIGAQARKDSLYLRVIKYIVKWATFVVFGIPMAIVGWFLFGLPITLGSLAVLNYAPSVHSKLVSTVNNAFTWIGLFFTNPSQTLSDIAAYFNSIPDAIRAFFSNNFSSIPTATIIAVIVAVIWLVLLIVYILLVAVVIIINSCIASSLEKKRHLNWVKENIPDHIDAYNEHILNKKKKTE